MTRPRAVLVVGTGLIGTSIALALRSQQLEVALADLDSESLQAAVQMGAGVVAESFEPDLVVVAVPPYAVADVVLDQLQRYPNATVTDVASVKAQPIKQLTSSGQDIHRFVGGHPMAGRAVSGPSAARADLFVDRVWVIAAPDDANPSAVDDVRWLAKACGAVCVDADPAEHDRAVALISHVPQLVASLLAAQLAGADPDDIALAGQGIRDTTRLADSSAELWAEILASNADDVSKVLDGLDADLQVVRAALSAIAANRDEPADPHAVEVLRDSVRKGNQGRQALPDKHGGAASTYVTILVDVEDRPGELARLFAAAGEAGVNLEDVRIEHTVGRLRATVELAVAPGSAEIMRNALKAGGWQTRS